jgi:hypothetical protein
MVRFELVVKGWGIGRNVTGVEVRVKMASEYFVEMGPTGHTSLT